MTSLATNTCGWNFERNSVFANSRRPFPPSAYQSQREKQRLQWKRWQGTAPPHGQSYSPRWMGTMDSRPHTPRSPCHFCAAPATKVGPRLVVRNVRSAPMRDTSQNIWPVLSVCQGRWRAEGPRNCSRLKETKDMTTKCTMSHGSDPAVEGK